MVILATVAATLLYLAPVLAFLYVRARRDRELWEVALDIPLAVAIDLLGVLLLTRFLPLAAATLVSRPLWLAAAGAWLVHRRRRGDAPAWPHALGLRDLAMIALAAALAVLVSLTLSR